MKLLRMQTGSEGADTVTHGERGWIVNNQSLIVAVPDEVADFMLADGRSGAILVEDPPGRGRIVRCPICHHGWREEDPPTPG